MYNYRDDDGLSLGQVLFRMFVCASLSVILGLHVYTYLWVPKEIEHDFDYIKSSVMYLSRGLTQVQRKHERIQAEMERVSSALPGVVAAAGRAKEALNPALHSRGIQNEITDYDRQMGDFALESAGGRVLDTGDTVGHYLYEGPVNWALHALTAWACRECQAARTIIQPGTLPGECWAFKGAQGEATIRLVGTVVVTGITIEHIPAHIDPTREIQSAPREVQLQGLRFRNDPTPYNFGTFEYNKNGNPIQYFDVAWPTQQGFNIVRVKVLSNWGHPVYTCLYRVRIHGELLPGQVPRSISSAHDDAHINVE